MKATSVYLLINAILYLALGIWCTVSPEWTSEGVGLKIASTKGMAEYVAVYGGLEFGVGVFYLISYLKKNLYSAALLFSVCYYLGLAFFRSYSLLVNGANIESGWYFYATEVIFSIFAIILYKKEQV